MATWTAGTGLGEIALSMAIFGSGFGLTVTPRSTAAVESVGRRAFGLASATVTVARMVGMAVGLAVLTAYGSTAIDRLTAQIYATPDGYRAVVPAELRDRPLRDGLVVQALERWAAARAAETLVGLFVVAGGILLVTIPAGLALGDRPRMLTGRAAGPAAQGGADGGEGPEPSFAL
jgi:hypothetical protein